MVKVSASVLRIVYNVVPRPFHQRLGNIHTNTEVYSHFIAKKILIIRLTLGLI